jgi:flagellar motor switch protein FliG
VSAKSALSARPQKPQATALAGVNKVAALLLAMDRRLASRLLRHFDENEIKLIAQTATDLGSVPKQAINELIEEFAATLKKGGDLMATTEEVEELLGDVVPPEQVREIMSQVRNKALQSIWARLAEVPETSIARYLSKEHPQIAAYVLSRATTSYAATTLKLMPSTSRKEIVRRMLAMKTILNRPLKVLEESFVDDVLYGNARNSDAIIYAQIAGIINKMDRKQMDEVLQDFERHSPKETERVRELLFTFEDLGNLSESALVVLLDGMPPDRISVALYGADAHLREHILSAMPARMQRMIEQEIATGKVPFTREVSKARRAIADLALQLIEQGSIEIDQQEDEN